MELLINSCLHNFLRLFSHNLEISGFVQEITKICIIVCRTTLFSKVLVPCNYKPVYTELPTKDETLKTTQKSKKKTK